MFERNVSFKSICLPNCWIWRTQVISIQNFYTTSRHFVSVVVKLANHCCRKNAKDLPKVGTNYCDDYYPLYVTSVNTRKSFNSIAFKLSNQRLY